MIIVKYSASGYLIVLHFPRNMRQEIVNFLEKRKIVFMGMARSILVEYEYEKNKSNNM